MIQHMKDQFAYFQGQFVALEDARIHVMTHAFLYGTAVFEGIRAYHNPDNDDLYLFRCAEHYERFQKSCKVLTIELNRTVAEFVNITIELLRKNNFHKDVYIRPVGYKSARRIGLKLDDENDFLIFAAPMDSYFSLQRPLSMVTSSWRRVEDNAIPARAKINGSYVNLSLAAYEARKAGFDEAILLNEDGSVSEAAGMNLFLVRKGKLITPAVTDNVLEGITRDTVFAVASDLAVPFEERTIDRSELYTADEVFLCGTGAEVAGIGSIDYRKIGDGAVGPLTTRIQNLYFATVRGRAPQYRRWVTSVWERSFP
jgi:branched-chain amino acid aminotransferase